MADYSDEKTRIFFDKLNVKRVFWSKKLGFLVLTLEKHSLQSKKHLFARCFSDGETVRPVMGKKSVHVAMSRTVSIYLSIYIISFHFFLRLSLFTFFLRLALSLFFLTPLHIEQWNNNDNNDSDCCCIRVGLVGVDGWWSKL